ncbi:hypothetical protein K402DRAFT_440583 [Aulographum hederae CBS 113979]|uniref:Uncharacterized protein n=1 Tax=Aulographum hederae CBS 113979 TaxID=1176131 RepID=A0A6G1GK74_9PEZI|nr:hypothetical protein K402DRAFT_440583 [Aulographum hederae CBS 113979]
MSLTSLHSHPPHPFPQASTHLFGFGLHKDWKLSQHRTKTNDPPKQSHIPQRPSFDSTEPLAALGNHLWEENKPGRAKSPLPSRKQLRVRKLRGSRTSDSEQAAETADIAFSALRSTSSIVKSIFHPDAPRTREPGPLRDRLHHLAPSSTTTTTSSRSRQGSFSADSLDAASDEPCLSLTPRPTTDTVFKRPKTRVDPPQKARQALNKVRGSFEKGTANMFRKKRDHQSDGGLMQRLKLGAKATTSRSQSLGEGEHEHRLGFNPRATPTPSFASRYTEHSSSFIATASIAAESSASPPSVASHIASAFPGEPFRTRANSTRVPVEELSVTVTPQYPIIDMEHEKTMLIAVDVENCSDSPLPQVGPQPHNALDVIIVLDNSQDAPGIASRDFLRRAAEMIGDLAAQIDGPDDRVAIHKTNCLCREHPNGAVVGCQEHALHSINISQTREKLMMLAKPVNASWALQSSLKDVIDSAVDRCRRHTTNDRFQRVGSTHIFAITPNPVAASALVDNVEFQLHVVCPGMFPVRSLDPDPQWEQAISRTAFFHGDAETLSSAMKTVIRNARTTHRVYNMKRLSMELTPVPDCTIRRVSGTTKCSTLSPGQTISALVQVEIPPLAESPRLWADRCNRMEGCGLYCSNCEHFDIQQQDAYADLEMILSKTKKEILSVTVQYKSAMDHTVDGSGPISCRVENTCEIQRPYRKSPCYARPSMAELAKPELCGKLVQERFIYTTAIEEVPYKALEIFYLMFECERTLCYNPGYLAAVQRELEYQGVIQGPRLYPVVAPIPSPSSTVARFSYETGQEQLFSLRLPTPPTTNETETPQTHHQLVSLAPDEIDHSSESRQSEAVRRAMEPSNANPQKNKANRELSPGPQIAPAPRLAGQSTNGDADPEDDSADPARRVWKSMRQNSGGRQAQEEMPSMTAAKQQALRNKRSVGPQSLMSLLGNEGKEDAEGSHYPFK